MGNLECRVLKLGGAAMFGLERGLQAAGMRDLMPSFRSHRHPSVFERSAA